MSVYYQWTSHSHNRSHPATSTHTCHFPTKGLWLNYNFLSIVFVLFIHMLLEWDCTFLKKVHFFLNQSCMGSIFVHPKRHHQSGKLCSKCGQIFKNKLCNNYSCGGLHELNMSCVSKWDVMEVNDKRQPVIEVVATRACWTNPWLGHVTGCSPMAGRVFTTKPRQLGKLIFHLSCIW